jgi:alpha-mannosidase
VHAVFQAGVIPEGSQAKTRWEGCDGTAVDSLAKPPGDAAKQKTFLNYGVKMGESLDMDHVAAICLAHWPGATCPWYEDLRRIAEYCPALGKFVTVEQYFRQTSLPVHQDRFGVDQYRSVYLKEAVSQDRVDPISSVVRYWRHRAAAEAAQSLDTLAALVSGRVTRNSSPSAGDGRGAASDALLTDIDLQDELDGRGMPDDLIQDAVQRSLDHFAGALPRSGTRPQIGYLVANPHSFVRRIGFEAPELAGLPEIERPIYSASAAGASKHVVVDVPAMGFAWVAAPPSPAKSKKEPQVLADECLLRNEFFEARVDPVTGALRSFHEYQARGNRLSQQLAFRLGELKRPKAGEVWQDADYAALYSIMAADSVKTTIATPTLGEIVARGRLMDRQGTVLATYRQTYRVWRGSRVLHVDIELDPKIECQPDPSNSYFSARFAWSNEVAELYRTVNETRHKTTAKRFESPHYVEIDDADKRTAILTGGLAFHRRQGPRMLDTLLIVHGERCRTFQFGIGLDLKHPMQEALSLLTPDTVLCQAALPPGPNSSGWLFHVDSRNVTATHWEPLVEEGQTAGFRVRLLETGGRAVKAGLSCFRTVRSARRMRFQGEALGDCPITEGKIEVQLAAHEWAEVEARW